jgi:hypothetical protein
MRITMSAERGIGVGVALLLLLLPAAALGDLYLGPEELVQADGSEIDVPGYSVPSFVDWNSDGVCDLIVGEGSGTTTARVRIYLNTGSAVDPFFEDFSYAMSDGDTLTVAGSG